MNEYWMRDVDFYHPWLCSLVGLWTIKEGGNIYILYVYCYLINKKLILDKIYYGLIEIPKIDMNTALF